MLVIIFILLFTNSFQVNSLKCMQEPPNIQQKINNAVQNFMQRMSSSQNIFKGNPKSCAISINIDDDVPNNTAIEFTGNCVSRDSTLQMAGMTSHSCYAVLSIDYKTKIALLELDAFNDESDKLFKGVQGNGQKSIAQYEVKADFDTDTLGMIIRIQCDTADDCALQEIRRLYDDFKKVDERLQIFEAIKQLLIEPPSSALV